MKQIYARNSSISQRDHLSVTAEKTEEPLQKLSFKTFAVGRNKLEGHSRSSKVALFENTLIE